MKELQPLAVAINSFIAQVQAIVEKLKANTQSVYQTSDSLQNDSKYNTESLQNAQAKIAQVASATSQLAITASQIAQTTNDTHCLVESNSRTLDEVHSQIEQTTHAGNDNPVS